MASPPLCARCGRVIDRTMATKLINRGKLVHVACTGEKPRRERRATR